MAKILACCLHTRAHKHTSSQKWGKVFENVLIMNVAFWIICGNKQSTKRKSVKQSERNTRLNERWFHSNDDDDNCNGWLPWHRMRRQIGTEYNMALRSKSYRLKWRRKHFICLVLLPQNGKYVKVGLELKFRMRDENDDKHTCTHTRKHTSRKTK